MPTGGTGIDITTGEPVPPEGDRYFFNRAAEEALKALTGQDLGVLPKDWKDWWDKHGAELLREAEAKERPGQDKAKDLLHEATDE